jgi:hypothetical protein
LRFEEATNMRDMGQTGVLAATRKVRELKLNRETLRVLGAGELLPGLRGKQTFYCWTDFRCTQGCGPVTRKC